MSQKTFKNLTSHAPRSLWRGHAILLLSAVDLIRCLLKVDMNSRLSVSQAYRHAWLNQVNQNRKTYLWLRYPDNKISTSCSESAAAYSSLLLQCRCFISCIPVILTLCFWLLLMVLSLCVLIVKFAPVSSLSMLALCFDDVLASIICAQKHQFDRFSKICRYWESYNMYNKRS